MGRENFLVRVTPVDGKGDGKGDGHVMVHQIVFIIEVAANDKTKEHTEITLSSGTVLKVTEPVSELIKRAGQYGVLKAMA